MTSRQSRSDSRPRSSSASGSCGSCARRWRRCGRAGWRECGRWRRWVAKLEEIRTQARGQATQIRLRALRDAANLVDRVSDAAKLSGAAGERVLGAIDEMAGAPGADGESAGRVVERSRRGGDEREVRGHGSR